MHPLPAYLKHFIVPALALALGAGTLASKADELKIDQGWSAQEITNWSQASQGSRLIPYSWLAALEQADSQKAFLDADFIASLRYLPGLPTANGANLLPLGFAIDDQYDGDMAKTNLRWKGFQSNNEQWVGLNCAACHTGQITANGKSMTIMGAPTLGNFQVLMEALLRALKKTQSDPAKFDRFAKAVLGSDDTSLNRTRLTDALAHLTDWQQRLEDMNSTPLRYGFGRLDAVGHILNKVALVLDEKNAKPHPADAPVSYPFLWNITQHDFVQWNGVAANTPDDKASTALTSIAGKQVDVGALGRNAGEVIGVFGDVNGTQASLFKNVPSSIYVKNLIIMEEMLERLKPPKWPDAMFGPIDEAKRARGDDLFKSRCATCHQEIAPDDLTTRFQAVMTPLTVNNIPADPAGRKMATKSIDTDPAMVCNTAMFTTFSGVLEGSKTRDQPQRSIGHVDNGAVLLAGLVSSALTYQAATIGSDALKIRLGFDQLVVVQPQNLPNIQMSMRMAPRVNNAIVVDPDAACKKLKNALIAYKGRPLNGIWATAPYLHNGSVVSLYELLLPAEQRKANFCTGTREYDGVNVGYKTDCSDDNPFRFAVFDGSGKVIRGNDNRGHDYGNAQLSEDDRRALVEYLKSL